MIGTVAGAGYWALMRRMPAPEEEEKDGERAVARDAAEKVVAGDAVVRDAVVGPAAEAEACPAAEAEVCAAPEAKAGTSS